MKNINYQEALDILNNKEKKNYDKVENLLNNASKAYYNSDSIILSDSQYDNLYNLFKKITGKNIVGAEPTDITKGTVCVQHEYEQLVGTLGKAQNLNDSREMIHKIINNKNINDDKYVIQLSLKFDGNSVTEERDKNGNSKNFLTRGRNGLGKDVSSKFKTSKILPIKMKQEYAIKYEAIIQYKDYQTICDKFNEEYANPRSLISGILGRDDATEYSDYITLVPLELRYKDGSFPTTTIDGIKVKDKSIFDNFFKSPESDDLYHQINEIQVCSNEDEINNAIEEFYNYINDIRSSLDFMIDGIVIEFLNINIINALGYDPKGEIPKYSYALKLPYLEQITEVTGIDYCLGVSGRITPRIFFNPINFNGTTHTKQQISNYKRFKELDLGLGSKILVSYNNDCLSYITKIDSEENKKIKKFEYLKKCPVCNGNVEIIVNDKGEETFSVCSNEDCPSKITGKIENFLIKMDIKGIKRNIIKKLYDEGLLNTIEDLYNMDYNKVAKIDGLGDKMAKKMKASILSKKYYDYEILGSLNINNISIESTKVICKEYSLPELFNMKNRKIMYNHIIELEGFSDIQTKYFVNGFLKNIKTIKFLMNRAEYKTLKDIIKNNSSNVNSLKIVFTGFRDPSLKNQLELKGHKVTSSVSGKTDILVYKGTPGATKKKAAEANNVKLMEYEEFLEFIKN